MSLIPETENNQSLSNGEPAARMLPFQLLEEVLSLPQPVWSSRNESTRRSGVGYQERLQSVSAVQAIIRNVAAERAPMPEMVTMPEDEVIQAIMVDGINSFFSHAQEAGLIPAEANELLNKLASASNILIVSGGKTQGKVLGYEKNRTTFPENPSDGPTIYINPEIIKYYTEWYLAIAKQAGIEIDKNTLRDAVIGSIAVHERAHILDGALVTQLFSLVSGHPQFSHRQALMVSRDFTFRHAEEVATVSIPNVDKGEASATHVERFASGFEMFALDFFLRNAGVADEVRSPLIEAIFKTRNTRLDGYRHIIGKLQTMGFNEFEIQEFVSDIEALCDATVVKEASDDISLSGSFQFWKGIGYTHPYSQAELRHILAHSCQELNEEKAQELLLI